jgi:4'-phosphopantetheinyl transferase
MHTEPSKGDFTPPPALFPMLGKKDVHVWKVQLDYELPRIPTIWPLLSGEEQARANRFHFSIDRDRFVACRGLLRVLIGNYLTRPPAAIRFTTNQYGKPFLADGADKEDLQFNVSHSRQMALFALCRGREIGVDLERIEAKLADEQIAEHFFSPSEVNALRALPADRQTEAFFLCWTRKEAFVKARGEGLSLPLDEFTVSLVPGEPARLLCVKGNPDELQRWSMRNLNPGPGYAAAVVVEGSDCNLKCWASPRG